MTKISWLHKRETSFVILFDVFIFIKDNQFQPLKYFLESQLILGQYDVKEGVQENLIFAWNEELSSLIKRCTIF